MKKFFLSIICVLLLSHHGLAFNVLQENEKYRRELNSLSGKQHAENIKHLYYYKGPANYVGSYSSVTSGSSSSKNDIYVKKGVKFKVDKEKQEQKLKEAKTSEEKKIQSETSLHSETQNKPQEKEQNPPVSKTTSEKVTKTTKTMPNTQKTLNRETKTVQKQSNTPITKQPPQLKLDIPTVDIKKQVKDLSKFQKSRDIDKRMEQPQIPMGKNADAE